MSTEFIPKHRFRQGKGAKALFPSWIPVHHNTLSIAKWKTLLRLRLWVWWQKCKNTFFKIYPKTRADLAFAQAILTELQLDWAEGTDNGQWNKKEVHRMRQVLLDQFDVILANQPNSPCHKKPCPHHFPEIVYVMAESILENPKGSDADLLERAQLIVGHFNHLRRLLTKVYQTMHGLRFHLRDYPDILKEISQFNEVWNAFKSSRSQHISQVKGHGHDKRNLSEFLHKHSPT